MMNSLRRRNVWTPLKLTVRTFKWLDSSHLDNLDACFNTDCSLKNRDLICVRNLTTREMKEVLWTALDVKDKMKDKRPLRLLKDRRISLVLESRNLHNQYAATVAASSLGATVTTMYEPCLDEVYNGCICLGPILSKNTDLLVIGTRYHSNLEEIVQHATVPIINLSTDFQRPIEAIATLLTLTEHFNRLTGLNAALIGCPNTIFHSYMCSFPLFGINVKLSCSHGTNMISPEFFNIGTEHCKHTNTILTNCLTAREAVNGADVIIAAAQGESQLEVSLEKSFKCDWVFIQNFGRGSPGINDYFVRHKRSLTYTVVENLMYTYAAVMIKMLNPRFDHAVPEPKF